MLGKLVGQSRVTGVADGQQGYAGLEPHTHEYMHDIQDGETYEEAFAATSHADDHGDTHMHDDAALEHAAYGDESMEPQDGDTCEMDDVDRTGCFGTPNQGGSGGSSTSMTGSGTQAPRTHAPSPTPYSGTRTTPGMTNNWTTNNAKSIQGGQPMRTSGQGSRPPMTTSRQSFGAKRTPTSFASNRVLQVSHSIQRQHAARKEEAEVRCYGCKNLGHIRRDCPMLTTGHQPGRPPPHTFSPHRAHFAEETGK
jgi:hypothetical protein